MAVTTGSYPREFYIGLGLAMSSSVFIGCSFILTKKGLLRLAVRAGQGGYGYFKQWMWWAGLILMGIGEAANFAAYAFAPASLVTPLGALSVLVSSLLAIRFLNEKLNLLGKIGCLLCILGATMIVIHAPKEQELTSMDDVTNKLTDPVFITYVLLVVIIAGFLIFHQAPRRGSSNPLVYITITGTIGSLTVASCKCLGVALKLTFSGESQLSHPLTWVLLVTVAVFIAVQMNFLNKALDVFDTSVVTPILYVIFTSCVILASAVLFKEWGNLGFGDVIGNLCGFLTTVAGVFLLQSFKDADVSKFTLTSSRKQDVTSSRLQNGDAKGVMYQRLDSAA